MIATAKRDEYWKALYDGFEEVTPLSFGLGEETSSPNWEICLEADVSRNDLLAAWALMLSRSSGESAVCIGVQMEEDITALRLTVDENAGTETYLNSIALQCKEQTEKYYISETELRNLLELPDTQPLYVSTVFYNQETGAGIRGIGGYSGKALNRLRGHLRLLVEGLRKDPDLLVRNVQHLSDSEREEMLREWNPEPTPYPDISVHAVFEERAKEQPAAVALVFNHQRLSYGELNTRANQLAHYLVETGVQPGQTVVIFMERGFEQIIATLAILKAGAAYVPLDVELPRERIIHMIEGTQPQCILSSHSFTSKALGEAANATRVSFDEIGEVLQSYPDTKPDIQSHPDDLAYVMYTSGSTGRPKGVEVLHRGIIRLLFGVEYLPYNADTVILHIATVSFDAATFEIWGSLLHGGTCIICPSRVPTLDVLGRLLNGHSVNTLLLTTAFFNLVIKEAPEILTPVKDLLVGGEALSNWHVAKALQSLPEVRLINAYGPTENTVISTAHVFNRDHFDPDRPIPIGRAIGNSSCYILDRFLRPVPVGVPGELYVGGDGVARGYTNRPDLTAERFLADPFSTQPNARMYKTGDIVYWNSEGLIEFVGRGDSQIKLRGFRIELQEIEIALTSFSGVEQAVVIVYEDDTRGKRLVGYVKVDDPEHFPEDELKQFASGKLPDYMVPSALVLVDEWSFTPSGKLDRDALPKPLIKDDRSDDEESVYKSETEVLLAEIWSHLLGLRSVPRTMNFFELGGDSLLAVTLFLKIEKQFGKNLPLSTLARASTIERLAKIIEGLGDERDLSAYRSLTMIQQGAEGVVPLFLVHGGAGNVLVFNEFTHRLGDAQPVYAFQWSGWDGYRGESDVKQMARRYKKELLDFYPEGPIRLGGYCIGGLIAIELVRLLEKKGRTVIYPLIVWDSPNIESVHYRKDEPWDSAQSVEAFNRMKEKLQSIRIETSASAPEFNVSPPTGKAALIRKIPGCMTLLRMGKAAKVFVARAPVRLKIISNLLRGKPLPMELRPDYCKASMGKAIRRYRSTPFKGDMLYFRSDCVVGRYIGMPGWWDDPFLGYAELCEGCFETYAIGGGHGDVLDIPEMAAIVRDKLQNDEST